MGNPKQKKRKDSASADADDGPEQTSTRFEESTEAVNRKQASEEAGGVAAESQPADFESLYLQQATQEFADDIDKLRKAGDFTDHSVPILVDALRQGAKLFSEEEKEKLMKG